MTPERLREVPILAGLGDAELQRVAEIGHERRLAPGDLLFREGDRATAFHIVLEGALETTRSVAGEQVLLLTHRPGGYLGAMALLTDTPYRGSTTATADTLVFELDGDELRGLAFTHPPLVRAFLAAIESVSGAVKGLERDHEKLIAVGQLAAGLAHELNNPAAAAAREVATLREYERTRQAAFGEIAAAGAAAARPRARASLGGTATADDLGGGPLDPIARSDREADLAGALEARGVDDPYDLAAALTEARLDASWVDRVCRDVGEDVLPAGLRFVASCAGTRILLAELEEATTRISDLVGAVRSYSHVDQAPRTMVDVRVGLEDTLSLLGHALREKRIEIVRDFEDIPLVEASGPELNQVWTNLIDNAVDALPPGGRLALATRRIGDRLCVEVADNGPGIPEEAQSRVFDAFFTTKPVGEGTGLGLDIARRLVLRHHGEMRLHSEPGSTRFQVMLPLT
ncbi:MAG TPA: ATP-binding protein [Miltoncostaeaceae bacterium]|nr:ATP-binding protein [Miltoncostaeaceae bacterium]